MKTFLCIAALVAFTNLKVYAMEAPFCGDTGVWVQILGAGGPELDDRQGSASYLVWIDNKARLLVDTGAGSSVSFDRSHANFEDLDAIVFTHLHVDHTVDFPSYIKGSYFAERDRPLPIFGPSGNEIMPSTKEFVGKLIGPDGAYRYLSDFLTFKSSGGYKVTAKNVQASGRRRWSRFGTENFRLSAIPVHHGIIPAVAWRVDTKDYSIVFTGDFSNEKDTVRKFAKDVDMLVVHHAIPEGTRGAARSLHVTPTEIGRVAGGAGAKTIVVSHRMNRTRGRESASRAAIEENFHGSILFANDMECWGL